MHHDQYSTAVLQRWTASMGATHAMHLARYEALERLADPGYGGAWRRSVAQDGVEIVAADLDDTARAHSRG